MAQHSILRRCISLALLAWCATAVAEDRIVLTMPTNKLHELVVSICQRAPCEGDTDAMKIAWMSEHLPLVVAALPLYYQTLAQAHIAMTVSEEHPE